MSIQTKLMGCFGAITFLACIALSIAALINKIVGRVTDYKIAQVYAGSAVEIAKIQAQDHITVACMQYSWFTSMRDCIGYGGVNGAFGLSWTTIILFLAISVVVGYWWNNRKEAA